MKRKLLALLLAAVMTLLSACGMSSGSSSAAGGTAASGDSAASAASTSEKVLRVSLAGAPTDINPLTVSTTEGADLLGCVYETLVRQDKEGKIEQGSGLAESWTVSDDGLVYTFKLRDAAWSDGTAITAPQFVYCWQKVLDPATASEYAYMLYPIANAEEYNTGSITDASQVGVKALDDKTLEVTLKQPTVYFISTLVIPQFGALPEGIVEKMGSDFYLDVDHMVFNGPFTLEKWNPDEEAVFVKNPNYWDAANVKLDRIEYNFAADTNTVVNLYETGELDVMQVQPDFISKYSSDPNYISVDEPVTEYLMFNMKNEYFANENIRRAFSMAINRDSYINDMLQNGCTPAYAFIPGSMAGQAGKTFREDVGDLFYDSGSHDGAADEAKQLLADGLKELGKTAEDFNASGLSLVIGEGDTNLKTAQVFQEYWKNVLGVDVEVKSMKYSLRQEQYAGDFTLGKEGWGADYDDPTSFLDLFRSDSPYNKSGYNNPDYDALMDKAASLTGDERIAALEDAERLLIGEDFVIAPTFFQTRHWVSKSTVHDVVRHGIGLRVDYKWAYVD